MIGISRLEKCKVQTSLSVLYNKYQLVVLQIPFMTHIALFRVSLIVGVVCVVVIMEWDTLEKHCPAF